MNIIAVRLPHSVEDNSIMTFAVIAEKNFFGDTAFEFDKPINKKKQNINRGDDICSVDFGARKNIIFSTYHGGISEGPRDVYRLEKVLKVLSAQKGVHKINRHKSLIYVHRYFKQNPKNIYHSFALKNSSYLSSTICL